MDIMFTVLMGVMLTVTCGCAVITVRSKSEYKRELLRLIAVGITGMVFYSLFLMAKSCTMATFFDGAFFICTDWVLVCMILFVFRFTDINFNTALFRYTVLFLSLVDSVSLVMNTFTGHMFRLTWSEFHSSGKMYWSAQFMRWHYWHLGFCYVMVTLIFLILIVRIIKTSRFYKKIYLYVLVPFAVVIVLNAFCFTLDVPVDYSVFLYAALAVCLCYYSLFALPKGLVEDMLANVIKDFDSAIVCYDLRGRCIYVNEKGRELFQITDKKDYSIPEKYLAKWKEEHWQADEDFEAWDEEYILEGEEYHFHSEYQSVMDENNYRVGSFFRITDMTLEFHKFKEKQYLATHDRLTGLYNKEYFYQKAEEILKRKPEVERYMVCINVQNYNMINNLFGEETADKILVEQAAKIKFINYEDCIFGRISIDKFAVLIARSNFDSELAENRTGKVQYMLHDDNCRAQISVGVYRIEDPTESPLTMYEKAMRAIDSLNGVFQKTVVFYDSKMLEQFINEKSVISEFDRALETGQFKMYLQPLVGSDEQVLGAEALARWEHPTQGIVPPVKFIPIVEKTGLIIRLDEYMWRKAAEKLKEWKNLGREDLGISVNISAKDFYYADLYRTFTALVEEYGIAPGNLNLEITETALMSDIDMHLDTLGKLQEYGFHIEIDDFGSGYSSLNMLKDIQADILKIDMLFLRETENRAKSKIILNSIISMAKALNMKVITEGVETEEQLQTLKEMGCPMFQGYYFSKPLPVDEFESKYVL